MLFEGKITLDPTQATIIRRRQPDGMFGRLLYKMTGGNAGGGAEQEVESLAAVSLLSQIATAMSKLPSTSVPSVSMRSCPQGWERSGA